MNLLKRVLILILPGMLLMAQIDQSFESRIAATVKGEPLDKLTLAFTPELRIDPGKIDKLVLEAGAEYKFSKRMEAGLSYKFVLDFQNSDDPQHRVNAYAQVKTKVDRFEPAFRLMYSSYDDDDAVAGVLGYRAKLDYDIPKCKIAPSFSAELYDPVAGSGFTKVRYTLSGEYKLVKHHYIELNYKLDQYLQEEKLKHIVGLGYTFKF